MLTPIDIDNYAFKKAKLGGYDINSVEEFMEMLSIDYETLYKENLQLKEDIKKVNNTASETKETNAKYEEEIREKLEEEIREELESEYRVKEIELRARLKEEAPIKETKVAKELGRKSEEESFEEICESMKTSAYFEAEEILRRANEVAETKINEVDALIKEKKNEYEELKKQIQLYKIRFEAMLQTQLKLLNNPEFDIADKGKR